MTISLVVSWALSGSFLLALIVIAIRYWDTARRHQNAVDTVGTLLALLKRHGFSVRLEPRTNGTTEIEIEFPARPQFGGKELN